MTEPGSLVPGRIIVLAPGQTFVSVGRAGVVTTPEPPPCSTDYFHVPTLREELWDFVMRHPNRGLFVGSWPS